MTDEFVSVSFRMKRTDWVRLHDVVGEMRRDGADAPSIQAVVVTALNEYFEKRGEPPLETVPFGRGGARVSQKRPK